MSRRLAVVLSAAIVLPAAAVWLANRASDEPPAPTPDPPPATANQAPGGVVSADSQRAPAQIERSIAAALNWLARHQGPDGNWSSQDFQKHCKDDSCTGPGKLKADNAVTAAALLTFLATTQTHKSKGPYRKNIYAGLYYLIKNQKVDGSWPNGMDLQLDSHGLATIALCECYGLTHDPTVGGPAQQARDFIQRNAIPPGERWHYRPGQIDDSSADVWQWLALESGMRCGLEIDADKFVEQAKWLREKTLAADRQDIAAAAAGMLALQRLGNDPDRLDMTIFFRRLNAAAPKSGQPRDCVAWLFASQALHAAGGKPWQTWMPKLQDTLVEDQIKQGCAEGSWSPDQPAADAWGAVGGRVFVTAMSALALEVRFGRLPLFKLDAAAEAEPPAVEGTPER